MYSASNVTSRIGELSIMISAVLGAINSGACYNVVQMQRVYRQHVVVDGGWRCNDVNKQPMPLTSRLLILFHITELKHAQPVALSCQNRFLEPLHNLRVGC